MTKQNLDNSVILHIIQGDESESTVKAFPMDRYWSVFTIKNIYNLGVPDKVYCDEDPDNVAIIEILERNMAHTRIYLDRYLRPDLPVKES